MTPEHIVLTRQKDFSCRLVRSEMMKDITFRHARPSDYKAIALLHSESWRSVYRGILPDSYLDANVTDERGQIWKARLSLSQQDNLYVCLAERNDQLVGFTCILLDQEPEWGACLDNLHVRPDLKGQRIGSGLFAQATRWLIDKRPEWPIHLWVFEANRSARRFYESLKGEVAERRIKTAPGEVDVLSLRYIWRNTVILLNDLTMACSGSPKVPVPGELIVKC